MSLETTRPDDDEVTAIAEAWEIKDLAVASLERDRVAAKEARGLRELVCDLVVSNAPERELLTALHALGALLGARGATPSAVSLSLDGARAVLTAARADRLGPSARAAVAEGYAGALRDALLREGLVAWHPPAGVVRISSDAFAVAAFYPGREPEDVADYVTRVARHLKEQGAKRVHIDGDPALLRELRDALLLGGMDVASHAAHAAAGSGGASPDAASGAASDASGERKRSILSKILG